MSVIGRRGFLKGLFGVAALPLVPKPAEEPINSEEIAPLPSQHYPNETRIFMPCASACHNYPSISFQQIERLMEKRPR